MLKDNPATQIAWAIRDIQHRHMLHIYSIIESYGLHPGQPRILCMVTNMDGCTQKEIAEKLQTSPAALAMSIKRMQKAGLLEKVSATTDQRMNHIYLTEKGKQIQESCLKEIIQADNEMLSGFSAGEIQQLSNYLKRIFENLNHAEE